MFRKACIYGFAAVASSLLASLPSVAEVPGGALDAFDKEGNPQGSCPLKHTDVHAEISGFIARVTLTQQFENPFDKPIEAIYAFPMSDRAAVDSMVMKVGERVIKGIIKEREEARRIYEAARDAGKIAGLLDQERPNIFTQSVANVLPGDRIEITISYVEYLKYEEGQYEFSFPMVVGPRYIPGNQTPPGPGAIQPDVETGLKPGPPSTDQVPDASRITPPVTPPGTRAGHEISLAVRVDAGVAIRDIRSELHEVDVERPGDSQAVVRLKQQNEIPNRDFVLKYDVAGATIGDAVLAHAGAKGGFFTLILQPPDRVAPKEVTPKEMMFVIDCSGSMQGFPIKKAKKAMRLCIEGMNPNDTFNLVSFSGGVGYCFQKPVPNTAENRKTALDYLDKLEGGGGTEMMPAVRAALGGQDDPERLRVVCFMTDGFVGNDMAILNAIQKNAKTARVFSFGIGDGVNRFLIEGMARNGRGAAEVVTLESDADAAAKRFHERIQSPILTDITVDFGGLPIKDVYPDPKALPDLFASRPLMLTGRFKDAANGAITVRGKTAAGPFERSVTVSLPKEEASHDVLATLWARERVDALMNRDWLGIQQGQPNADIKKDIIQLGLEFALITQYTSFVAVEEKVVTEGGKPKTVQVPVEMTDGVSYEGVFGEQAVAYNAPAAMPKAYMSRSPMRSKARARLGRPGAVIGSTGGLVLGEPIVEARPAQAAPPVPTSSAERPKDEDKTSHPKLDRSLWDLPSKVVNGNYQEGKVKVVDGWVEVFVRLIDLSTENLDALKKLGVKVVSQAASSKTVLARIRVEDLVKVAELAFVTKIEPPAY